MGLPKHSGKMAMGCDPCWSPLGKPPSDSSWTGYLEYFWRNPDETVSRRKVVLFNYIPEFDWIVAAPSYLEEFYSPVWTIRYVIVFSLLSSLLLILPSSFWISGRITNPLRGLIRRMSNGQGGLLSEHAALAGLDEISQLTAYFNACMDSLDRYGESLQEQIAERKQAEAALRVSEERYRSVIDATPDPIVVYDIKGRVTYLNPAFSDVFGWSLDECLGRRMDRLVPPENREEIQRGFALVKGGKMFISIESLRLTKSGKTIDASIRGAAYRDREGRLQGSVIAHRDVTELRRLGKEVMDIGDRERQFIGQDLRDDLGPHLVGIEGLIKVPSNKIRQTAPEASELAVQIAELLGNAIDKTRHLARGLCPVYLVAHGLEASRRELAQRTAYMFRMSCRFHCDGSELIRDNNVATHVFRIAQEALHNAIRHGKATHIDMDPRKHEEKVTLTIRDNGHGLPDDLAADGMALRIMGFRAKIIDGSLDIHNHDQGGTIVTLTVNTN